MFASFVFVLSSTYPTYSPFCFLPFLRLFCESECSKADPLWICILPFHCLKLLWPEDVTFITSLLKHVSPFQSSFMGLVSHFFISFLVLMFLLRHVSPSLFSFKGLVSHFFVSFLVLVISLKHFSSSFKGLV